MAISDYTECIYLFPLDASAYYERANIYVAIGQDEKALHDFTLYTMLITDYKQMPESLSEKTDKLQKAIGFHLASVEMERRKKDPSYVFFLFLFLFLFLLIILIYRLFLSLQTITSIPSLAISRAKRNLNTMC